MKLKFLALQKAPDFYSFEGEKITAHYQGQSEEFDLSLFEQGDKWEALEDAPVLTPETLDLEGVSVIRHVDRDAQGELHLTLCQSAPMAGHWRESEWIDVTDYIAGHQFIREMVNGELVSAPLPTEEIQDV